MARAGAACAAGLALALACAPRATLPPAQPSAASAAFPDADSLFMHTLEPGVAQLRVHDRRGPWAIDVVEVDTRVCRPVLEARKPDAALSSRALTTELGGDALVAVNADFFRLPGGTPVGAHVARGVPWIGPTDWPVFGVTQAGVYRTGVARLAGHVRVRADSARVVQVNRHNEPFTAYPGVRHGVELFTARADSLPVDTAAVRVLLRRVSGDEGAGSAVVIRSDVARTPTLPRADTLVLMVYGDARAWAGRRAAGDTVAWQARVVSASGEALTEVVGGFPLLLDGGRDVLGTQVVREEFGQRRHPRTAIGWTADQRRLFLVVVDGRQEGWSDGMSLPELTWVFRRLGADYAVNLDGGGSTAMTVRGALVNRPSDREGERAVGNALALVHCGR